MKRRKSSPKKDEPRVGFAAETKPNEKGIAGIIGEIDNNVKHPIESAMTLIFDSFDEIEKLQRKAREVRDG